MRSRQRLFWFSDPYDLPASDDRLVRAAADSCAFHIRHCPEYAAIARRLGFSPDQLKTAEDLARIPPIPTLLFKRHAVFSMSERRPVAMRVTSSGTSSKFSQVNFDWGCVLAEVPMILRLGWRHRLISPVPANCVVLGYKPDKHNRTGVTRTMFGLTFSHRPCGGPTPSTTKTGPASPTWSG